MTDAITGGAIFYLVIASITTAVLTLWLTFMYARPGTSIWVLASTFLSWYLCFATFFYLLPVDLLYIMQNFYLPVWNFVYWVSFTLTWVFLPVQQTYAEAGEFTFGGRLWAAIRFNTIFYVIAAVIGGGFLIYIAIQNQFGTDQVIGLIVMLANTWGLTLAVISLGYGLVEVPRNLWNNADRQIRLNRVRYIAANVNQELAEGRDEVADAIRLVRYVKDQISPEHELARYVTEIENNLGGNSVDATTQHRLVDFEETQLHVNLKKGPITLRLLADLNYYVKQKTRNLKLLEDHWAELIEKEDFLQDMIDAQSGKAVVGREGLMGKLWNIRVFTGPVIARTISVFFALVSVVLIWGELVLYHPELSPFAQLLNALRGTWGAVFFATCILAYQSCCAFFALFQFRIMKFYHMHFNRRTDENSILFNAALLLRLIGPMGYNFLQLVGLSDDENGTVFVGVVGQMDHVPFFGTSLPVYLPILISVFAFGSLFNIYGRVMRILGVNRFSYDAKAMTDDTVQEGAAVLAKGRRQRDGSSRRDSVLPSRSGTVSASSSGTRLNRPSRFQLSDHSAYAPIPLRETPSNARSFNFGARTFDADRDDGNV